MEYVARVYVGTSNTDCVLIESFDSLKYDGTSGSNAYDTARKFALEQVKTHDFAKIHFDIPEHHSHNLGEVWLAGFDHAVRGRCIVVASEREFTQFVKETKEAADRPIYSPNQIFAMPPVRVETKDILSNLLDRFLKEPFNLDSVMYEDGYREFETAVEAAGRIEIRYVAHVGLGSDESWMLASLWFDNKPVAILTQEGEDGYSAYTTDQRELHNMVEWVHTLAPKPKDAEGTVIDPNKPLECLTEFWNHTLHDFYDVSQGLPIRAPKPRGRWDANDWNHYHLWEGVKFAETSEAPKSLARH